MAMAPLNMALVLLALVYANAQTKFELCSDGSPAPNLFHFANCSEKCIVVGGDVTDFQMEFDVPFDASEIDVVFDVVTTLNIRNVTRYELPEPGCSKINAACPLTQGDTVTLNTTVGVVDFGKEVVVLAEFRLESPEGVLACATIPVLDVKRPAGLNASTAP